MFFYIENQKYMFSAPFWYSSMYPSFNELLCVVSAESVTSFCLLYFLFVQISFSLRSEKTLDYPYMGMKLQTNLIKYISQLPIWVFFGMYLSFLLGMHTFYNKVFENWREVTQPQLHI